MATNRVRTLEFLPEIFQTPTNAEFLAATLDQIVNPPNIERIQGYIGSKFGYGVNAKDYYVTEPTKTRTDYQLEPGVVFTKTNESTANDFITYPGILDSLKLQGAVTDNNQRLFQSQFYSWDSFANLDKIINFNQYYWLPEGPPAVTVASATVFSTNEYIVTDLANGYNIRGVGSAGGSINPTLTLLRGGTYQFAVNQASQFWIQGAPGVTGYSPTQPNLYTRDVYGVTNNGATQGFVTFTVPSKTAQDEYNFPGNNLVDVVSTTPFANINGQLLSTVNNIDGVTSLDGLRVMFYNDGVPNEIGYVSTFFGETNYDTNGLTFGIPVSTLTIASCNTSEFTLASGDTSGLVVGQTVTFDNPVFGGITGGQVYYIHSITSNNTFTISTVLDAALPLTLVPASGTMVVNINQGLYEEGYYTTVNENFYRIQYVGDPSDPIIRLIPDGIIPTEQRITPQLGIQWISLPFYRNQAGVISLIPYLSAPLSTLYYQDGTSPNKVGIIRIIDSNFTNTLNVTTEILGKKNFTSTNGVVFTNGLKVTFDGDVVPSSYLQGEYYVEGVGTAIELIPTTNLVCPETYTLDTYVPYDTTSYDIGNYDVNLYVPLDQDYITIARNSINRNAWSRSNRWFHIDVINATATYNDNPDIPTIYATAEAKAKRPIIEFYPNLKLFDAGTVGKKAIDFIDTRTTDALSTVADQQNYYPDIEVYTGYTGTVTATLGTHVAASSFVPGTTYQIYQTGTTDWNHVAGTVGLTYLAGNRILCVNAGTGSGTATALVTSTTLSINAADVTGKFQVGMYITDSTNLLPNNTQITNISGTTTLTLDVSWETPAQVYGTTVASFVASNNTVNNYALFPGSRVVFAADTDLNVRNKIYVSNMSVIDPFTKPVITLTVAEDGLVLPNEQVSVSRGFTNQGTTYYFNGLEWNQAQQKVSVNQAPKFDIFDKNGISLGDKTVYASSSFAGCTLFAYGLGAGLDDPILSFPLRYSSINNVGDISFDVTLNSQTFNYVSGNNPITQKVNTGYVYNYTSAGERIRQLGWETAIAPSTQYQLFSFDFDPTTPLSSYVCDVAMNPMPSDSSPGWPTLQVYINNIYQDPANYNIVVGTNSTTVTLNIDLIEKTVVQILILSDQVSKTAYYTIPWNLNNNPFNGDIETANVGDIRGQYQSIFYNNPDTTGQVFGPNNYRDLGNLVPYGTAIIQNSSSLVLPGAFLRKPDHNLFNALLFNSREYVIYKQLIVDTVNSTDYNQRYTPAQMLNMALDQITSSKSEEQAFFWSDMLPSKAPYRSNTYTFANSLDTSIYPLTQVYNFSSANYNGVLVYLTTKINGATVQQQLVLNVDYTISPDSPSLTVTKDLQAGDKITINEYNQTYGSYVPNTPTKLGLYPAFIPEVILDSDYFQPTYFILGHDGSYTKLYGDYNPTTGVLTDFRDQVLLEFETRIYNNLKLSTTVPIKRYEVIPGFFRNPTYSVEEFTAIYSPAFLNWIGQNRIDYKTQFFDKNDEFTYNYRGSGNKLNKAPIDQGYWRGVYEYFYDTTTPNETPWQMLGFANEPTWWATRYGPAPYTSDNGILWGDLEAGYIWNNGDPYVVSELARPGLSKIIPVNSNGELLSPFVALVGNYNSNGFQKQWRVGDDAPAELSYRRSSTFPFDLMRIFALTRPAEFFNLGVDLDNYKYNAEFNQYLVNDRSHLVVSDIQIYGNGTAKTSYINWIVDFEKQLGLSATNNITTMLDNLDVRLVYRLAGYSDKDLLRFYVEKGTPNSVNSSLLIPDESYAVLLYDNQPFDRIAYSGVIVQQDQGGYSVYGNAQNFSFFRTLTPIYNGNNTNTSVEKIEVSITNDYSVTETLVPYGTKFYSQQEVAQFLASYGAWLVSKGMVFGEIENGIEVTWNQMIAEFLYWSQTGWEDGSVVTLNPAATVFKIDKDSTIVQPLTLQQTNFVLNQNYYPIKLKDIAIERLDTAFRMQALNQGDTFAYGQFDLGNFEHGIVFNNVTEFNDVIYNLVTGLRQNRITVRGAKTAEWNGTVNAYGFILNQDNVKEWDRTVKYTKGVIVTYKNKYWTALKIIEPSMTFNELEWKEINYTDVQKGLLPNASTRSYESTLFYDTTRPNLEKDADLLGFSLIGYRPRDYLALADLTDITQVNVYKNFIKNKGTRNAVNAFKGINLPQGGIDYDVYENWAILQGKFGGVLNNNFVEFRVNENNMTGNPSIVSLTQGIPTVGSMQEVPMYSLFNYGEVVTNPNILNTIPDTPSDLYPSAGYVNFNDVKMSSYFYSGLPRAVDKSGAIVPIQNFYVRNYMWLANFKEKWQVYSLKPIGQVIQVRNNLNGTATVTFNGPHNLSRLDPIAIINFATNVDGYYIVTNVVNLNEITINLTVVNSNQTSLQGRGIGLSYVEQRVATPSEIASLDLLESDFAKNTVWVDENDDGGWAVYRKSLNYQYQTELVKDGTSKFGSAVAYTSDMGYLISDAPNGVVYRYEYNAANNSYDIVQTITHGTSFGSKIVHENNVYAISEPTSGTPKVYIYSLNNTTVTNQSFLYQTITAPVGVTDWGTQLSLSTDANWLYISDTAHTKVYVYRRNQVEMSAGYFVVGKTYTITNVGTTNFMAAGAVENKVGVTFVATGVGSGTGTAMLVSYDLSTTINGTDQGLGTTDGFGKSITTDYNGDVVVIGAPNKDYNTGIKDWGVAYAYQRTVQNIEIQYNTIPNQAQVLQLAWTPTAGATRTGSAVASNYITANASMTGFAVNDAVIFNGSNFGDSGIQPNTVYYIHDISGSTFTLKTSRSSITALSLVNASGLSFNIYVQVDPLYVTVNGTLVQDNNYAVIGSTLVYTGILSAGDIVNVSDNQFNMVQEFNSDFSDRTNIQYAYAMDMTSQGSELLIGSPYEIDSNNYEGAVYRYTNAGGKYGVVIGTQECNVTGNSTVLINGYSVALVAGNAASVAERINNSNITNVEAASTADNKLIIQVRNTELTQINQKLLITAFQSNVLSELGLQVYVNTQRINCPRPTGQTQFGKAIKFNEFDSVVISAPVGTRYAATTFDFTDDENIDNDTVFDNNATRFVETSPNAGAVYMFDYLGNYNESLVNSGAFVYAQSVNNKDQDYGFNPLYGSAVDFNENVVIAGAPDFSPNTIDGQVVIYQNSVGLPDWSPYRQSAPIVDINTIQNTQLFSAETNNTLVNLDYIDPLQGKILGAVRQNIDFVTNVDPARYNSDLASPTGYTWGADHVGQIWFNTNNVRFVNYHQNDVVYNSKYWGAVFPGSDVAVYSWVASFVPPNQYQGPGAPLDPNLYSVSSVLNSSNVVVPVYYFWVRNSNIIFTKNDKTLSDNVIAAYISNPRGSGISYMVPLLPNTFGIYNSLDYFNANDTVFHVGFSTGNSDDVSHQEFNLIRENYPDDFLPGLPQFGSNNYPHGLYDRFLDSLSGCDEAGQVVPNPFLPKAVQSGVLARPRQSFFYNRYAAIENYLMYANTVLAQFPIAETRRNAQFLYQTGENFDTTKYWGFINWWATGYNDNTKSAVQVPIYADLSTLNVAIGTIVTVEQNGDGKFEVYRYDGSGTWTRIGLQNGTIAFSSYLWDYSAAQLGYDGSFYDTNLYDQYPSTETRYIIRALNEQIYIDELVEFRNKSLILIFEYIQSETSESQNFLPWLNKTSLADVSHTIRELVPVEVFQSDNEVFLEGYLNEVKPYHVVIKDFYFKYTKTDVFEGDITDFDLPAQYNASYNQFISPQLVYTTPNDEYQYQLSNSIWQSQQYNQWFQNYGVSLTGEPNYKITILSSFLTAGTRFIIVDNAQGFPINGTIRIGDELIAYSSVDRSLNMLSGLTRGVNGTAIVDHIPGENIFIDLPPVLVLNGGRGYIEPPKVIAYIDETKYPAPRTPAVLEAVMSLDSVLQINVIDPGSGYAVLPEIKIDPAVKIYFSNTDVNSRRHTVQLYAPNLVTGDLLQYFSDTQGADVGLLADGEWYYINVLATSPTAIVALYSNYSDAVKDRNRIKIYDNGVGSTFSFNFGARASAISSAIPVRENNIHLRYDRTTYTSQVQDWVSGAYYGSFFAGSYNNSESVSSSSILLESTRPPIDSILAGAQGVAFEIVNVGKTAKSEWSSFIRYVGSTHSSNNAVRLIPLDGNNPDLSDLEPNASGTTIGFYVGMPVKFEGATIGGLVSGQVYYVHSVLNEIDFTVTTVEGGDPTGSPMSLATATATAAGLQCIAAEVTNNTILTVNYPGILNVTATQANTNKLTVPISAIGTGGTNGFYTNLPIFFTDNVFGGVTQNQVYYVTTVVDEETFTISEKQNPLSTTGTEVNTGTLMVTVEATDGFSINDPIIFTDIVENTGSTNIVAGTTYYVSAIDSVTTLQISTAINGPVFDPGTATGSFLLTNQKDTLTLSTATGSMTMNVSLPVSPGQVNGQLFTLYDTSVQYPGIASGTIDSLVVRTVNATIHDTTEGINRIAISEAQYNTGTNLFYANMPVRFNSAIGGLSTGVTYYVTEYSGMADPLNPGEYIPNIQVGIKASLSNNQLVCDDTSTTASLYLNMQIIFTGVGLGGIVIGQPYFVKSIVDNTHFTISDTPGGTEFDLTADSGSMVGTGDPFIVVSASLVPAYPHGTPVTLSDATGPVGLTQYITGLPVFDISYILGGYRAIITDAGSGFAINNTITISGAEVGGTSPYNDITLTVNTISSTGQITSVICAGTVPSISKQYYLKVLSPNTLGVYSNPLMTVPVNGADFNFVGFTESTVTNINSGTDELTLSDASGFVVNDAVVFTGDTNPNTYTGIVSGNTYYIVSLSGNNIQISATPAGSVMAMGAIATVDFTIAKAGSIALLPEPFYFNQSIVKFNNRVYLCVISNNDPEFVFGKWELLDSGDRRLNAMDRVMGYYQPTINMPGVDLSQLFEGVTYPNATYFGNKFQPSEQFALDTVLTDQPFYPTEVNVSSILWNGTNYFAAANLPTYSAVLGSVAGNTWNITKLTNVGVGVTDIINAGGYYVMTSTNSATPVFRSNDGINWTTNGYYTPYGSLPYDENPYDVTALNVSALALQSVAYLNGYFVAVGDNIVRSNDTYIWREVNTFANPELSNELYSVTSTTLNAFTGFIAVGAGQRYDYTSGLTQVVPTNLILYSPTGEYWTQVASLTPNGLYGVASNSSLIVAVGENGIIYSSNNGGNWTGINQVECTFVNASTDVLNVTNTNGFVAGATVRFSKSFCGLTAGTTYYISSVINSTQIQVSASPTLSPVVNLTTGDIAVQTMMYAYDSTDPTPATLHDITYANGVWIAVGDAGTIKTSTNSLSWTKRTSGSTQNLNGITYNSATSTFVVVGDNNTILESIDNGVTWASTSLFTVTPTVYDVQGAEFSYGYGPEELVPGVVTDSLIMTVQTKPGSTWPTVEYAHFGYNSVSLEITPTSATQTVYSFDSASHYPIQIQVQVLDGATLLGTTLGTSDYSVNWVNRTVTLHTPLETLPTQQKLRIDVYEVGNGDQLVKSNTDTNPIRTNHATGFDEIYLNCNYSANIFRGSGVIRTGSNAVEVEAVATDALTNEIACVDITNFTINAPITFIGGVFGGIQEDVTYYVKSISTATTSITVSATYNPITGIAGPTFQLSTDTGSMYADIRNGTGTVWTDPVVYHNGTQLVLGKTNLVVRTKSSDNAITTNSTIGLVAGTPITFSNTIFGGVIQPLTTYYIKTIVDNNEFTISETLDGPILTLTDATGTASYVSNDYAFGIQPNGIQAKMVFATGDYDNAVDYIVYSVFGETEPQQYGFAVPQTQEFTGNGSASSFNLNYYVGGTNNVNAIVQVDGIRLTISQYTISNLTNTITFTTPPANGASISVTTFNDTAQQYLHTQYGITGTPGSAFISLTVSNTTHSEVTYDMSGTSGYDEDSGVISAISVNAGSFVPNTVYQITTVGTTDWNNVAGTNGFSYNVGDVIVALNAGTGTGVVSTIPSAYDQNYNWLTLASGSTSSININDSLIFSTPTLGGLVAGKTYYVVGILSSTEFEVSETVGGEPVVLTTDSGTMLATANGLTVAPISVITNTITPPLAVTFATSSNSGTDQITVNSTAGFVVKQPVIFQGTSFDANILTDGTVYFVDSIVSSTEFTIMDQNGNQIALAGGSGDMQVTVGGTPAIRVTTSIDNMFDTNTLIRIDGTLGSIELNNNTYYARVITNKIFDLYSAPYDSSIGYQNSPVTTCSSYTGGGYTWRAGTFYLVTTTASATSSTGDKITVASTSELVYGTPVIFTQTGSFDGDTIMGGLVQGTTYYVSDISNLTQFSVSLQRHGAHVTLTSDSGSMNVTQWEQANVDRLWVTLNGLRIPSSKLRMNASNEVSILTEIVPGDEVIITNMIPSATPNELIYLNLVNQIGQAEVYRANTQTKTWLTASIYDLSTEIYVNDVTRITNNIIQNVLTPAQQDGYYNIGLTADKNIITGIRVLNNTTGNYIDPANYEIIIVNLSPILQITAGSYIAETDSLTITTLEGNTVIINGEQIKFGKVDFETNTLQEIQRGANGTPLQPVIPVYNEVYGLISSNKLPNAYYDTTWNSYVYNPTLGDPLQISQTIPAKFLNVDIT